jgi:DNA-binding IclR family transcriptional regulator
MPIKPSPAVGRAVQILEYLTMDNSAAATISEIARRTGMSKATCHSVLLALAQDGYVRRDPSLLTYTLGPGLITLGAAAASTLRLPELAHPELEVLTETLGLTTAAAVTAGSHLVLISTASPPHAFQVTLPIGQMVPFAAPLGAAFVAWAPREEVDAWLDRAPLQSGEAHRQYFDAALAAVREQGYSVTLTDPRGRALAEAIERYGDHSDLQSNRSEHAEALGEFDMTFLPASLEKGRTYRLTQVSAPVFDPAGNVAMVVLCVAVGLELTSEQIAIHGDAVRHAADRLTQLIANTTEVTRHQRASGLRLGSRDAS